MKSSNKWINKQNKILIKEYLKDPHNRPPYDINKYLNGLCDQFAIASSYYFNLEIFAILEPRAIIEGNKIIFKNGIIHAFCLINSKTIFDAKGIRPLKELYNEYIIHPDAFLTKIKVIDLYYKSYKRHGTFTKKLLAKDINKLQSFLKTYYEKDFKRYKHLRNIKKKENNE